MSDATIEIDHDHPADTPHPDKQKKGHPGLRCVVVTPEATALDDPADYVVLPLFDGELGVAPGRAPLIGRLGYGSLRIRSGSVTHRYFVDGGFVQVRDDVVTVLTARALPSSSIDADVARRELDDARSRRPTTDAAFADKARAEGRARALLRLAGTTSIPGDRH